MLIWVAPEALTAGSMPVDTPSSCSHCHPVPDDLACQRLLSAPCTKASSRGAPRVTAAGRFESRPPTSSHAPVTPVAFDQCQSAWSVPRTNASSRPPPHEIAAGLSASTPPARCQPVVLDQYQR